LKANSGQVSVLMLTYNSGSIIRNSLSSVADFADEIIVVDGGSVDGTLEVARAYGAKILSRKFSGFDAERNAGLQIAHGEWILSLDSDEALSSKLKSELMDIIGKNNCDVVYVPRLDYVAGHVMKSFYPDYQPKLYRNGCLTYIGRVHEVPEFKRPVRKVLASTPLVNHSDVNFRDRFYREVRYWTLSLPGKRSIRRRLLSLPFTLANYPLLLLLRRRFIKDGLHGAAVTFLFLAAYVTALNRVIKTQGITTIHSNSQS
jgi:glycosyltransferase involved in cell wall biosynthesis